MIKLEAKDLGNRIEVEGSGRNATLGELKAVITAAIVKLDEVSDNNNLIKTLSEVFDYVMETETRNK